MSLDFKVTYRMLLKIMKLTAPSAWGALALLSWRCFSLSGGGSVALRLFVANDCWDGTPPRHRQHNKLCKIP